MCLYLIVPKVHLIYDLLLSRGTRLWESPFDTEKEGDGKDGVDDGDDDDDDDDSDDDEGDDDDVDDDDDDDDEWAVCNPMWKSACATRRCWRAWRIPNCKTTEIMIEKLIEMTHCALDIIGETAMESINSFMDSLIDWFMDLFIYSFRWHTVRWI